MNETNSGQPNNIPDEATELKNLHNVLDANKVENIATINLEPLCGYEFYFLIGTVLSTVHMKKVADEVTQQAKLDGYRIRHSPGQTDIDSGWIVMDCGPILVHLFLPPLREKYALEKLVSK